MCSRSRTYRNKVTSKPHDPLRDRGELPTVKQVGERLATDFIIVQKTKSGSENVVQVIRDEFSGWVRAFPLTKRDADTVGRNLLEFLGPAYNQTHIIVKSDPATQVISATKQLHS